MAICLRDLDQSQKIDVLRLTKDAVATGATVYFCKIDAPSKLHKIDVTGVGLSGTPTYNLEIHRWTSAGLTVIAPGSAVTLSAAYGLSGPGVSATFNSGSTLAQLQQDDLLVVKSGGSGAAVTQLIVSVVREFTQDIKKSFGVPA